MAAYFFDTSGLVKRYASEAGSHWVRRVLRPSAGHRIYVTTLIGPELASALVRRSRTGTLSATALRRSIDDYLRIAGTGVRVAEVDHTTTQLAIELIMRHGLRGFDAVHLAAALEIRHERTMNGLLQPLTFVSADRDQLAAASAEGLPTDDPNTHR